MKLELATAHQILLELSKADLLRFDLSVERLLMPSAQTRAQICRLLSALALETGQCFQIGCSSHFDVLPDLAGGCLLIVSDCERKAAPGLCGAYYTGEINDLIDAARAVRAAGETQPVVTLLQVCNGYLLLADRLNSRIRRLLSEFLIPVCLTVGSCEVLREHCRVMLADAPFSVLCGGA